MTKATEDALSELHGAMAEAMASKLEDPGTVTASDLNVIRQFLKDNGINADPGTSKELKSITDKLPDLDNVYEINGG